VSTFVARSRRQAGFIPGMVIEINIALVILAVAVGILWQASTMKFRPQGVDAMKAELVAPAATSAPTEWGVAPAIDMTYIAKTEGWTGLIVPVLLVATVISIFVAALYWPYWVTLVALCAAWWYGLESAPGNQSVKFDKDGAVQLLGAVRFAAFMGASEKINLKGVEGVLVHKERPVAYLVFRKDERRLGWRIYADSQAEAHAIAALLQSSFQPPAAAKPEAKK
jgi:hypothetical protein